MKIINRILWVLISLMISSCSYVTQGLLIDEKRNAKTIDKDVFGDSANKIVYLEQNWDRFDSLWFYNTTQGSNLMPYEVFLNLEQADNQDLFRNPEHINKYRFLAQEPSFDNPDGLPVGFVEDSYKGNDYIGFTCAACHTGQINYQGVGIRIDGAPSLADFEGLFYNLEKALQTTLNNPDKFDRLAAKMVETGFAESKEAFRPQLQAIYEERQRYNQTNAPLHGQNNELVPYGYGRLDAFGRIYNRILEHLVETGVENSNRANAPVSYPFLWDTPLSDFVQWNGVGDNNSGGLLGFLGPLGRNTGEVLGVFATFDLSKKGKIGYVSSANKHNLVRLERQLNSLESPVWPEDILPAIDKTLAQQGEKVFYQYQCDACHMDPKNFDRSNPERLMIAQFSSLGMIQTDKIMAMNAVQYTGKSGYFKGEKVPDTKPEETFGEITSVLPALSKSGTGVILEPDPDKWLIRRWIDQLSNFILAKLDNKVPPTQRHVDFEIVPADAGKAEAVKSLLVYKGRSLNGIWATAPYLHNGSVPNLYELFLPSCSDNEIAAGKKCRSNRFTVGSREFDPSNVGLLSKDKVKYPNLYEFDTSKPSNSNAGHEYAAGITPILKKGLGNTPIRDQQGNYIKPIREQKDDYIWFDPISEDDRLALVEYLKTL